MPRPPEPLQPPRTTDVTDYAPVRADDTFRDDVRRLAEAAFAEDLRGGPDWTSLATVPENAEGVCRIRARKPGIAAGLIAIPAVLDVWSTIGSPVRWEVQHDDGRSFEAGQTLAELGGPVRDVLTVERTVLNLLGRLCGIATATRRYVDAIGDRPARLYDTRKTTPGLRLLEKYAVRCGGGHNHRHGLHDGILVKDNHLALAAASAEAISLSDAVAAAIDMRGRRIGEHVAPSIVEVEVDTLDQFRRIRSMDVDIILLDNFTLDDLRIAVEERDRDGSAVELEASGNVRLDTVADIAATGVERISSGALTHAAASLDLGLDWVEA